MTNTHQLTYDAFISYSSKDRTIAQKVQHFLQSYKDRGSRKALQIYLDETDITGGSLPAGISSAIARSRVLIVCCSPSAANSNWVDKEIQSFLSSHQHGIIAPILIEGDNVQSIPHALPAKELRIQDLRKGLGFGPIRNPARDELLRLLSLISGRELREIIDWGRRKLMTQSAYAGVGLLATTVGAYSYVQKQKETRLSDVRADLTLALMIDDGLGEGEQLNDWYSKDCSLTLAVYRQAAPQTKSPNAWPWRSDTFPLHEGAINLTSRSQSLSLVRNPSTAGTWTSASRTFTGFSGNLEGLAHASNWHGVLLEARVRAIEQKRQLKTQESDAQTKAMSALLSYYSIAKEALTKLEDSDVFVWPIPIVAALNVTVNDRTVYSSHGIPVSLTEHDEDARRLHIIHFPLGGPRSPRRLKL